MQRNFKSASNRTLKIVNSAEIISEKKVTSFSRAAFIAAFLLE